MSMKQQTLAMAAIVPWSALCEVIEPHYPKAGNGRPPIGLERMLRIHFIQHWFNLADLACDALYDSASLRRFVGIDLGREASRSIPAPSWTPCSSMNPVVKGTDLNHWWLSQMLADICRGRFP